MKLAPFALLVLVNLAHAQIDPNRVVVSVNGEEIKGAEYYHRMEFLPGVGKRMGANFSEFPPGFLTLDQLITEKLVLQLAKEKGALPSDLEITNEISIKKEENPNLLSLWISSGRSEEDLKNQMRYELAQFKLQTFGISKTDQEVEAYYTANPEQFINPKQMKLRLIAVLSAADKTQVDADLTAGKAFTEVAKAKSADASKISGGDYGTVPVTTLGAGLKEALATVKIGETSKWIETKVGDQPAFIKFLVENILPEEKLELTPKLKRAWRRKLMLQAGSVKNNLEADMKEMRKRSKIDIKQKEFAEPYQKFIDSFLKQGSSN